MLVPVGVFSSRRNRKYIRELDKAGFPRRGFAHRLGITICVTLATVVGLVVVTLKALTKDPAQFTDVVQIAAFPFALAAFILTLWQWREARHEVSLDRFYDRLNETNKRLDVWVPARTLAPPWCDPGHPVDDHQYQQEMYTYCELDNLEYAIHKYELGYMSPYVAHRSLRTFKSRCASPTFRALAWSLVNNTGYDAETRHVVDTLRKSPELRSADKSE